MRIDLVLSVKTLDGSTPLEEDVMREIALWLDRSKITWFDTSLNRQLEAEITIDEIKGPQDL